MTDKLVEFVQELDQNPELQEKYQANPKEVAESYGVAADDVELLLSNDMDALDKRFEIEGVKKFVRIQLSK
jgi:hypothetical protein